MMAASWLRSSCLLFWRSLLLHRLQLKIGEILASLPTGTPISVKAKLRHYCSFERATDAVLACSPRLGSRQTTTISFERKEVRQVSLEHSDDTNALRGLTTGGAIGFAIGASGHKIDTGTRVIEGVIAGAIVGGSAIS